MQPRPGSGKNSGSGNYGRVVNPRGPQVDPRPVKKTAKPPKKARQNPIKPGPSNPDDKIYRTMPITEKQLGAIKKMYGFK
jgi:hypothetical protein